MNAQMKQALKAQENIENSEGQELTRQPQGQQESRPCECPHCQVKIERVTVYNGYTSTSHFRSNGQATTHCPGCGERLSFTHMMAIIERKALGL